MQHAAAMLSTVLWLEQLLTGISLYIFREYTYIGKDENFQ